MTPHRRWNRQYTPKNEKTEFELLATKTHRHTADHGLNGAAFPAEPSEDGIVNTHRKTKKTEFELLATKTPRHTADHGLNGAAFSADPTEDGIVNTHRKTNK